MANYKVVFEYNLYRIFILDGEDEILIKEYNDIRDVETYIILKNGIIKEFISNNK